MYLAADAGRAGFGDGKEGAVMLKPLPEGLVPFEDCGFARHPFAPLAGEPVRVDCRVDADDGRPVLRLCVDGEPEREIASESEDGRRYHFLLGAFVLGQKVRCDVLC